MSVNCGTTIMAAMKTRPASLGCMLAADGVVALTWEWQAEAALADDRRHEELCPVLSPVVTRTRRRRSRSVRVPSRVLPARARGASVDAKPTGRVGGAVPRVLLLSP